MRLEWYIAQRYLRGTHRGRALISISGVVVGVTVLIVVISVMNGFERDYLGKMLGAYGHIKIYQSEYGSVADNLYDYQEWVKRLGSYPGVAGVSPIIESEGIVVVDLEGTGRTLPQIVQVRGMDPALEAEASDLIKGKLVGEWSALAAKSPIAAGSQTSLVDPFAIPSETPGVFLGIDLAKYLFRGKGWSERDPGFEAFAQREILGRKVKLASLRYEHGPSGMQFFFIEAEVKGLFKTGFYETDLHTALISLDTARVMKGMPAGAVSVECLEIRLDNPSPRNTYNMTLGLINYAEKTYHGELLGFPWTFLNQTLVKAVQMEKVVMGAILMLVVLVAAFGIASTLVMTVLEKTREIGSLIAMGTRRRSIMWIFILNGFQVGVLGTFLGILLGLGLCWLVVILNIPIPGGGAVYVLDVLPVEVRWLDVTVIALFSVAASTLAGVFPAWKAAKLQPVEALSYE